jgi:hypothetical protein
MSDYAEWDSPADNYVPDEPSGYVPGDDYSIDNPANYPRSETNPGGYDPSASYNQPLSNLSGVLGSYKKLFEKIKSGQAGATEYAAAAGILGLLMPSLNQPKTKGWKGSIDLNRQFTRTPIAQPAYTPYAQSAAPVMGRQFFNSTYGAPVTTGGTLPPVTTPPINPDAPLPGSLVPQIPPPDSSVNIATDGGGMAQGGIAEMAKGGRANRPRYLRGETDGMQDRIPSNIDGVRPAKLSHGEFVIPADVVSHLGNGNSDAGAKVLYKMMDRVRQARTGNKKQGRQINPEKFTPGGIAGYAGGGAVAFQTGGTAIGSSGATSAPLGTSTETNISEWAGPYVGDMLSKTAALTNTPYQAYQGPMVAGTAPLQSKVFSGLQSLNFPGQLGQSFTSQGAYTLPTAGAPGTPVAGPTGIASQYMNPYLSAVLTPQLEEMRRQSEISRKNLGAKFSGIGGGASAFGGGRQAIESAELERNLMQEQNKAIGTGYANAYDRAMGQFNTEQGQAKTLADMMAGAGQQQRGIEQEGITALQKQYETELLDPYTKLRFQKEMLGGLPVATASTTANQSTMGQLGGSFQKIQDLMDALGLNKP